MSKPFSSTLTPQLLNEDKITIEMKSLLRGRGPPYNFKDIANVKKIMRMRLNASDDQDDVKLFFIFSLSNSLIERNHIPLDILDRVLPIISGVNSDNLEDLLGLWVSDPNEAERIQKEAVATPSSISFRPITPQHQRWINACNDMLDRIIFNPAKFPIIASRPGSSLGLGGVAVVSRPITTTPIPTFSESTSIDSQIRELTSRLRVVKNSAAKVVLQSQIDTLKKKKEEEGNSGGKKRFTNKKRHYKKRKYKKRSKSIKKNS
jgi:hypothetical protein